MPRSWAAAPAPAFARLAAMRTQLLLLWTGNGTQTRNVQRSRQTPPPLRCPRRKARGRAAAALLGGAQERRHRRTPVGPRRRLAAAAAEAQRNLPAASSCDPSSRPRARRQAPQWATGASPASLMALAWPRGSHCLRAGAFDDGGTEWGSRRWRRHPAACQKTRHPTPLPPPPPPQTHRFPRSQGSAACAAWHPRPCRRPCVTLGPRRSRRTAARPRQPRPPATGGGGCAGRCTARACLAAAARRSGAACSSESRRWTASHSSSSAAGGRR